MKFLNCLHLPAPPCLLWFSRPAWFGLPNSLSLVKPNISIFTPPHSQSFLSSYHPSPSVTPIFPFSNRCHALVKTRKPHLVRTCSGSFRTPLDLHIPNVLRQPYVSPSEHAFSCPIHISIYNCTNPFKTLYCLLLMTLSIFSYDYWPEFLSFVHFFLFFLLELVSVSCNWNILIQLAIVFQYIKNTTFLSVVNVANRFPTCFFFNIIILAFNTKKVYVGVRLCLF